ncbi:FliO/MopB family protein (plasmid) [Enterobacter asburiae]|uniref:FliO/MopB family protein n=1 Tax=Enterobacter asburiae TaxID=61645 RepID=UPI0029334B68|nr:flagellar biosynthetic protein FliO [Enterobacter asburiae]EMA4739807.1 flagellar biosynthetic protein FliO [Enterobacter asburiae]
MQTTNTSASYAISLNDLSAPGSLLFIVGAALAFLVVTIAVTVWLLRHAGLIGRAGCPSPLTVKHRQNLGTKGQLLIVEVQDRWLLLGVTAASIRCLTTLAKPGDTSFTKVKKTDNFQTALVRLLKKQSIRKSQ